MNPPDQQTFNVGTATADVLAFGNNNWLNHPGSDTRAGTQPGSAPNSTSAAAYRLGFAIDIISYSSRPEPARKDLQRRLRGVVDEVLNELRLTPAHVDDQAAGDSVTVFLPPGIDVTSAFPALLRHLPESIATNNLTYRDTMRLRATVSVGLVATAPAGYVGDLVVELHRLLESKALRDAAAHEVGSDLVLMTSDRLHHDVVHEGRRGISPSDFHPVDVEVKEYRGRAWLWRSPP